MTHDQLRALMLKQPRLIRSITLVANQVELYLEVKKTWSNGVTTKDLSAAMRISPQNAGSKLATLHDKGYFSRRMMLQDSGGVEYIYTAIIFK